MMNNNYIERRIYLFLQEMIWGNFQLSPSTFKYLGVLIGQPSKDIYLIIKFDEKLAYLTEVYVLHFFPQTAPPFFSLILLFITSQNFCVGNMTR